MLIYRGKYNPIYPNKNEMPFIINDINIEDNSIVVEKLYI
jgi:hypothetical protein